MKRLTLLVPISVWLAIGFGCSNRDDDVREVATDADVDNSSHAAPALDERADESGGKRSHAKHDPDRVSAADVGLPESWNGRQLFDTDRAWVFARDKKQAKEADRYIREIQRYVEKYHHVALGKGLVIVMESQDPPMIASFEEGQALEADPDVQRTPPRVRKSPAELRTELAKTGVSERTMLRGTSAPLPPRKRAEIGLASARVPWALAAPSNALCVESGQSMMMEGLRHKDPNLDERRAKTAMGLVKGLAAKPFEMMRPQLLFMLWAQRQGDWSDEQRRSAIREFVRWHFKDNGLKPPPDEDIGW